MSNSKPSKAKVKVKIKPAAKAPVADEATKVTPETVIEASEASVELARDQAARPDASPAVVPADTGQAELAQPVIPPIEPPRRPQPSQPKLSGSNRPIGRSKRSIAAITVITLAVAAGALSYGWVQSHGWRADLAQSYVEQGSRATGAASQLDYRLAYALDTTNDTAAWHVAEAQLASGNSKAAARTLTGSINARQGRGLSPALIKTHLRVELELAQIEAIRSVATTLAATPTATEDQLLTAAIGLVAVGQGSSAAALAPRVASPEAARRLSKVLAGNVSLASEMTSVGLVRSAQRVLNNLSSTPPRDLLLARILTESQSKSDRAQGADLYANYVKAMPADVDARLAYADLLDQLKRPADAATQRDLAARLKAGQP